MSGKSQAEKRVWRTMPGMPVERGKCPMDSKKIAFILSIVVMMSLTIFQVLLIEKINNGDFVYPLDDTYIHLKIAKNIAENGVWGINGTEMESADSSLIYPLILAFAAKVIFASYISPLIINLLACLLLLWMMYHISKYYDLALIYTGSMYALMMILVPLPLMVIIGMEHTLQLVVDIFYLFISLVILGNDRKANRMELGLLAAAAFLVTAVRYEGMFLLGILSICFMVKRQYASVFAGLCAGAFPIIAFGVYSVLHGSYFLPNSLLLKGNIPSAGIVGMGRFLFGWIEKLYRYPYLLMTIVVLSGFLFLRSGLRKQLDDALNLVILAVIALILLHTMLAGVGYLCRYDAYLVALAILVSVLAAKDMKRNLPKAQILALAVMLIAAGIPLAVRSAYSSYRGIVAAQNIHDQQVSMARFVSRYYHRDAIALNDIGAVSYFTNCRVVDIFGLASKEVVDLKRAGKYHKENLSRFVQARDVKVAMIFDSWFRDIIPDDWIKVGAWTLKNNVICGDASVSFYAFNSEEAGVLSGHLNDFRKFISPTIVESGMYLRTDRGGL